MPAQPRHIYAIGLGANQPQSRTLTPKITVGEAIRAFNSPPFRLIAASPIIETAPLGPSLRRFANAAVLVATDAYAPDEMLAYLKQMERAAGRRAGQRWGARPLDLDILLWNGGPWSDETLTIPHPSLRERTFVLEPLHAISPRWRDPLSGLTVTHLLARLKKARKSRKAS